jgi:hypothetical protein
MYCVHCGAEIHDNAVICPKCGCAVKNIRVVEDLNESTKEWIICLLLSILFGMWGAHRFYVGKTGTALLQLLTLGGLGIWYVIDIILILVGEFTDSEGKRIQLK